LGSAFSVRALFCLFFIRRIFPNFEKNWKNFFLKKKKVYGQKNQNYKKNQKRIKRIGGHIADTPSCFFLASLCSARKKQLKSNDFSGTILSEVKRNATCAIGAPPTPKWRTYLRQNDALSIKH